MTDRDDEESECARCGLLASRCLCRRRHEPTREELEEAREQRLTRAERGRDGS